MEVDKVQQTTIEGAIDTKKREKIRHREKIFHPVHCGKTAAPTVQQNLNKKDTLCLKLSLEPAKHYSSTN